MMMAAKVEAYPAVTMILPAMKLAAAKPRFQAADRMP